MVTWRQVVALVLVAGFLGGLAGAFVTNDRIKISSKNAATADEQARGTVVLLGPPGSFRDIGSQPFCVQSQHFCIVEAASGELVALYTYDPHVYFRSQGCTVDWRADFSFTDPRTNLTSMGWFRSGCSGSTFDMQGHLVFGPSPRDMDRFPLSVKDDANGGQHIEVDTRVLICGAGQGPACQRAPRPE